MYTSSSEATPKSILKRKQTFGENSLPIEGVYRFEEENGPQYTSAATYSSNYSANSVNSANYSANYSAATSATSATSATASASSSADRVKFPSKKGPLEPRSHNRIEFVLNDTIKKRHEEMEEPDLDPELLRVKTVNLKNRKNENTEIYVKFLDPRRAIKNNMFTHCLNFVFAPSGSGKTFFMVYLLYFYLREVHMNCKSDVFIVIFGQTTSAFNLIMKLIDKGFLPPLTSKKKKAGRPRFLLSHINNINVLMQTYYKHKDLNLKKDLNRPVVVDENSIDYTEFEWVYFFDDVTSDLYDKKNKKFFADFFSQFRHLNITSILNTQNIKNIDSVIRDQVASIGSLYLIGNVSGSNLGVIYKHFGVVSDRFDSQDCMEKFFKKWISRMPQYTVTVFNNLKSNLPDLEEKEKDCIYVQKTNNMFMLLLKKIDLEIKSEEERHQKVRRLEK